MNGESWDSRLNGYEPTFSEPYGAPLDHYRHAQVPRPQVSYSQATVLSPVNAAGQLYEHTNHAVPSAIGHSTAGVDHHFHPIWQSTAGAFASPPFASPAEDAHINRDNDWFYENLPYTGGSYTLDLPSNAPIDAITQHLASMQPYSFQQPVPTGSYEGRSEQRVPYVSAAKGNVQVKTRSVTTAPSNVHLDQQMPVINAPATVLNPKAKARADHTAFATRAAKVPALNGASSGFHVFRLAVAPGQGSARSRRATSGEALASVPPVNRNPCQRCKRSHLKCTPVPEKVLCKNCEKKGLSICAP